MSYNKQIRTQILSQRLTPNSLPVFFPKSISSEILNNFRNVQQPILSANYIIQYINSIKKNQTNQTKQGLGFYLSIQFGLEQGERGRAVLGRGYGWCCGPQTPGGRDEFLPAVRLLTATQRPPRTGEERGWRGLNGKRIGSIDTVAVLAGCRCRLGYWWLPFSDGGTARNSREMHGDGGSEVGQRGERKS